MKEFLSLLLGMRELRGVSGLVTVVPAVQQEQVEIVAESFRDRIDPTARESWKFRILPQEDVLFCRCGCGGA